MNCRHLTIKIIFPRVLKSIRPQNNYYRYRKKKRKYSRKYPLIITVLIIQTKKFKNKQQTDVLS